MFSRVPRFGGQVREKTAAVRLCHGGTKAREIDCFAQCISLGFLAFRLGHDTIQSFLKQGKEQLKMDKRWASIVVASLFEVGWVIGLKSASDFVSWTATLIAIGISFRLLIAASRTLPAGTAYAVFAGLGTVGTVLAEMALYDTPPSVGKFVLIALLLAGVIGLKREDKGKVGGEERT